MDPLGTTGTKLYGAETKLGREKGLQVAMRAGQRNEWKMERILEHLLIKLPLCRVL